MGDLPCSGATRTPTAPTDAAESPGFQPASEGHAADSRVAGGFRQRAVEVEFHVPIIPRIRLPRCALATVVYNRARTADDTRVPTGQTRACAWAAPVQHSKLMV